MLKLLSDIELSLRMEIHIQIENEDQYLHECKHKYNDRIQRMDMFGLKYRRGL